MKELKGYGKSGKLNNFTLLEASQMQVFYQPKSVEYANDTHLPNPIAIETRIIFLNISKNESQRYAHFRHFSAPAKIIPFT